MVKFLVFFFFFDFFFFFFFYGGHVSAIVCIVVKLVSGREQMIDDFRQSKTKQKKKTKIK
jgi:hypothetical protein